MTDLNLNLLAESIIKEVIQQNLGNTYTAYNIDCMNKIREYILANHETDTLEFKTTLSNSLYSLCVDKLADLKLAQ